MMNDDCSEEMAQYPNKLAKYYQKFKVTEKYWLTGHAHQAWPDCSFLAQEEAWRDAAEYRDQKWERAFKKADRVRRGFQNLLDDKQGLIALGSNTHELLLKFLSSLDYKKGNHIITTDHEFYSAKLQLDRLHRKNIVNLTVVAGNPVEELVDKICKAIHSKTLAVIISAVYFNTGEIVENLSEILAQAEKFGAKLIIDVYHALNVVPYSLKEQKIEQAFIVGGGYKYCQLGEGNAFMRYPSSYEGQSIITGWLDTSGEKYEKNSIGNTSEIFLRATYDPVSHYRAARVFDFFLEQQLTVQKLRQISQKQIELLVKIFDTFDFDPRIISRDTKTTIHKLGGFIVLKSPHAQVLQRSLMKKNVYVDVRQDYIRIGPAPYISDQQLIEAMWILKGVVSDLKPRQKKL